MPPCIRGLLPGWHCPMPRTFACVPETSDLLVLPLISEGLSFIFSVSGWLSMAFAWSFAWLSRAFAWSFAWLAASIVVLAASIAMSGWHFLLPRTFACGPGWHSLMPRTSDLLVPPFQRACLLSCSSMWLQLLCLGGIA